MITSSAAVIPWADPESKEVDPRILDRYVGLWSDTPEPNTVTITRDGSRLMAQGSDEKEKTELLAVSDDTFVVRGEPALITFQRDPDGQIRVTTWRDIGGSLQIGRRLGRGEVIQSGVY